MNSPIFLLQGIKQMFQKQSWHSERLFWNLPTNVSTLVIQVQVTEVTVKGAQIIDMYKCEIPDGKYPFTQLAIGWHMQLIGIRIRIFISVS